MVSLFIIFFVQEIRLVSLTNFFLVPQQRVCTVASMASSRFVPMIYGSITFYLFAFCVFVSDASPCCSITTAWDIKDFHCTIFIKFKSFILDQESCPPYH